MQKKQNGTTNGIISIEEYIRKRKKLRAEECKKETPEEEKSTAWMMAELYV